MPLSVKIVLFLFRPVIKAGWTHQRRAKESREEERRVEISFKRGFAY